MKRKLAKEEKARRQAWRTAKHDEPIMIVLKHHLTKRERLAKEGDPKVTTLIDMRQRLADLFKGTTYRGPYVHVTHKQAYEKRQAKRQAKATAEAVKQCQI